MNEITTYESDDEYARLWSPETNDRVLFVTHLTDESATRYQFNITDPSSGDCSYTRGEDTTPPRIVVEILNDEGYTVSNLPNITSDNPLRTAVQLAEAIEWLKKHGGFQPGDIRTFAYNRAHNVVVAIEAGSIIMDVIGPERYGEVLQLVLQDAAQSGVTVTREDLLDPRTHSIEFLQNVAIEMRRGLPIEDQEKVTEKAEDHGMVGSGNDEDTEATKTWSDTTQGTNTYSFDKEAFKRLQEDGWFPEK